MDRGAMDINLNESSTRKRNERSRGLLTHHPVIKRSGNGDAPA